MEFHVNLAGPIANLARIEESIQTVDPAALLDIDGSGQKLRVVASMQSSELVSLLNRSGYPVTPLQVIQLPSTCCGGCGG